MNHGLVDSERRCAGQGTPPRIGNEPVGVSRWTNPGFSFSNSLRANPLAKKVWFTSGVSGTEGSIVACKDWMRGRGDEGRPFLACLLLTTTLMNLENFPTLCRCKQHRYRKRPAFKYSHPLRKPCPFEGDETPRRWLGSCCSLNGAAAALELAALGEMPLAARVLQKMSAEEAHGFALELRAAVCRLEGEHATITQNLEVL
jgi:hypothetical protein